MARILLGVTGSVAAIKTPALATLLGQAGHEVKVVATEASLYFFDPAELKPVQVLRDSDEWPGRDQGQRYQRQDTVLHIELRRWAELLLIAPLDANTLAKMAGGLADNCLTCVYRAWDMMRPIVLAPAMNTLMWQHPATARHLASLATDTASDPPTLHVVPPATRELACGDVGIGAMASLEQILLVVADILKQREVRS